MGRDMIGEDLGAMPRSLHLSLKITGSFCSHGEISTKTQAGGKYEVGRAKLAPLGSMVQ